jgi:glycosyltransferase involved in cell wall biosynthesis
MRKRLNEFRPDVIHIASPSPLGDFAFQYKRNRDIPVITIYHTHFLSYIGYYLRPLPFLVKTVLKTVAYGQKKFYDQSSLMYIPTMQMVEELKGFNFDTKKMKIWQRGMNHELFNPGKRDVPRIKELTQNGKPNVLFASRLVWEKNLATLIRIYRKSKDEGDKYNFIIAGDGVAEKPLTEKMPDAYMLGKVDHDTLAALYASADVFLFPSVSETYGNVVVEAMASGCPCVIAKGGGSQSLVVHGKTGFLCDPEDASDYLARIDQIIGDPSLRKELVSNGIEYTQSLNWESLCETYFDDVARLGSTGELPSDTVEV